MRRFVLLMCVSRLGVSVATMSYAGLLPTLTASWHLSAGQAGTIQAAFNIAYAISLLVASWLADHVGAKRVFLWSLWCSTTAFVAFAGLVRSYESALLLFALVGLLQGGTYTPAIILAAQQSHLERRGIAIGAMLSAASLGFIVAILLTTGLAPVVGYEVSLWLTTIGPLIGAVAGTAAMQGVPARARDQGPEREGRSPHLFNRSSVLLTLSYTGHSWELLGMWAWAPAFLSMALAGSSSAGPLATGLFIALAIHASSIVANLCAGSAADRVGRRKILIMFASAGALCSFLFGWCLHFPAAALLVIAFVYGFTTVGDSGVISTAMTEVVPPRKLGSLFALRSILGYGAGSISPIAIGYILDASSGTSGNSSGWGVAFAVLGIGGATAALCSALLPKQVR